MLNDVVAESVNKKLVLIEKIIRQGQPVVVRIDRLETMRLRSSLDVLVEPDGDGFIAKTFDLPTMYGYGDDRVEAVAALKSEIESLYNDLMGDDNFSEEWLQTKKFLKAIVDADSL